MSANPASPVLPQRRARSFEELWDAERIVSKMRKEYPRKCVDELIAWLIHDGKKVVAAGRDLFDKAESSDAGDLSAKREKLLDSKEELLRCARVPQHISKYAATLEQFLGEGDIVLLDDDCEAAADQHSAWFASLCSATRHSTATAVTLQTMLAEKHTFLGTGASSVDTAASLTEAWAATECALDAEMTVLKDTSALRTVRYCARSAMALAEQLREYLSRAKEDYLNLEHLDEILQHLELFPQLALEGTFLNKFGDIVDLPLSFGDAANDHGSPHMVQIDATSLGDFKRLSLHSRGLSNRGNAIPIFVVKDCKLWAKYAHQGLNLKDLGENYEINEDFLTRMWGALASATAAFRRDVGREHRAITAENVFVDAISQRVTLGAHAIALAHRDGSADVPALFEVVEKLGLSHALVFKPRSSLKLRVECDTCESLCVKSTTCPGGDHIFCEECLANLIHSKTDQSGAMKPVSCPMPGCRAVWSDVEIFRALPITLAEQASKRRKLHHEIELRQQLRQEIQAEVQTTQQQSSDSSGQDLPQSIVTEALELLVDKCRGCGAAFGNDFDGCFALSCVCGSYVCAYCLVGGTEEAIHGHIASGDCPVRRQMFPDAAYDPFHQGRSKDEEFAVARRIRIVDELHTHFQGLTASHCTLLAQRIRRDVEENGIDFSLVFDLDRQL